MILSSIAVAQSLPSIDEPLRTGGRAPEDAAVVIGIEDYVDLPDVPFATADAQAVYDLLVYTRGIPPSQVRLLTGKVNDEAIVAAVEDAARTATGRVFVYFAGHGAASTVNGERLLLGFDTLASAPSFDSRAVPVGRILGFGSRVVLIVDACYGAAGRTGEAKSDGRWIVPVVGGDQQWVAAAPNEVAGPLPVAGHGAFTYLAVGALRGWADGEQDGVQDGRVTGEEAQLYVQRALRELQLVTQTPSLSTELGSLVFTEQVREPAPSFAAPGPGEHGRERSAPGRLTGRTYVGGSAMGSHDGPAPFDGLGAAAGLGVDLALTRSLLLGVEAQYAGAFTGGATVNGLWIGAGPALVAGPVIVGAGPSWGTMFGVIGAQEGSSGMVGGTARFAVSLGKGALVPRIRVGGGLWGSAEEWLWSAGLGLEVGGAVR